MTNITTPTRTASVEDLRTLTDWKNSNLPPVRAALAEAVVAELANVSDDAADATWHGGGTPAFDVTSHENGQLIRRNAKSVRIQKYKNDGEYVVLARSNAQKFNPEKLDRIVMVLLADAVSGYRIDLETGTASMEGHAVIDRVWDVPVTDINEMMEDHDPEIHPQWRNVEFPIDDLDEYLVFTRR